MTTKLGADDKTLADRFKNLRTFGDVASLLDVKSQVLGYYLHRANNYKKFSLRKRTGGARFIHTPATPLKIIQRKLNQVLYAVYGSRSPVHGFARGKSIVTNARRHLHRKALLNFDLENFFPSIHFGRVKGLFEGKPYLLPTTVAIPLAQICCHEKVLPIGAPTSPVVANMICAQMDAQLKHIALSCGCVYTRYADDITFSCLYDRFPPPIAYRDPAFMKWVVGDAISKVILANGFSINSSKTRAILPGRRREVTGIVINERLNVKRTFIRQVRAMLHACEKWGVVAATMTFWAKFDRKQRAGKSPDILRVLRGKIEFVGSVRGRDDALYLDLLDRYLKLDKQAHTKRVIVGPSADQKVVDRALWVLQDTEPPYIQGTAFAAESLGLLTAAHAVKPKTEADSPASGISAVPVHVVTMHDHVDVARVSPAARIPVAFKLGSSAALKVGDRVKVLGFPKYHTGGTVNVQEGQITAYSPWYGVPQFIVDCSIVQGNSGGPVLNTENQVVEIAVRGQETPKRYGDDDEMSRFVPIDVALKYLI